MHQLTITWITSITVSLLLDSTACGVITAIVVLYLLRSYKFDFNKSTRRVLITGARGGLGSEIRKLELLSGGAVIKWDSCNVDVRNRDLVHKEYNSLCKERISVDVIYCTAGVVSVKGINDLEDKDISRTCNTNIRGVIWIIQSVLRNIDSNRVKNICVVSSAVAGVGTVAGLSEYCASKWTLTAFLESIRPTLESNSITLTIVSPSFMTTPMFPGVKMKGIQNLISPPLHPSTVARHAFIGVGNSIPQMYLPPLFWIIRLAASILPVALVDVGALLIGIHHSADSITRVPSRHGD